MEGQYLIIVAPEAPADRWVIGHQDGRPVAIISGDLSDADLAAAVVEARAALCEALAA